MPDGFQPDEREAVLAQLEQDMAEDAERRRRGEREPEKPGGHNRAMLVAAVIAGC